MGFNKLYEYSDSRLDLPISVNELRKEALKHCHEDEIFFVKTPFDVRKCLGYMRKTGTTPPPYGTSSDWACHIFYAAELNICWRRFVCCKELMHLFDAPDALTASAETFEQQLEELASVPLWQNTSQQTKAEFKAYWMALGVLCPLSLRNLFIKDYEAQKLSDYDIALTFRVPEAYVPTIMSDRYEPTIQAILGNGN